MSVPSQVLWPVVMGSFGGQTPFASLIPIRARLVLIFTKTRSLGVLVSWPTGLVDKVVQYLEAINKLLQINGED